MKPGIINTEHLNPHQMQQVWEWLTANGCRHYVSRYVRIIITGNRIIVPTFDIERVGQKNKKWARHITGADLRAGRYTKIRTYRIRVPLGTSR